MLTADLARFYETNNQIKPLFIDKSKRRYHSLSKKLIEIFENNIGNKKGKIEQQVEELTKNSSDYKVVNGLSKLLKDKSKFKNTAEKDPVKIRRKLFDKASKKSKHIGYASSISGGLTSEKIYKEVSEDLDISVSECKNWMFADIDKNKRLVRFNSKKIDSANMNSKNNKNKLTDSSEREYRKEEINTEKLLDRYNIALVQAILYNSTKMEINVWDSYSTVFGYVKLFGLMHRIYPIDKEGKKISSTNYKKGYKAILDGPASLFSKTKKYGIRMANFFPALPLCEKWNMKADILPEDSSKKKKKLKLDQNKDLNSHYKKQDKFDSDLERTFARKWSNSNTKWNLKREKDILDLGEEIMIPDFSIEHPDGRKAIFEIIGFWTPEYIEKKIHKIEKNDKENFILAISDRLNCSKEDLKNVDQSKVISFKTGINVYDVIELANKYT